MGDCNTIANSRSESGFLAELRARCWAGQERRVLIGTVLVAALAYAFWPSLVWLFGVWIDKPDYSHGLLVPAFSVGLLWLRRARFPAVVTPAPLPGLALFAVGLGLRIAGGFISFLWLDQISLLPCLAGLALTFGGYRVLRWSLPAILFLIFMIPMPYRFQIALGFPLQTLATEASTFVLQCLGQPAVAEGHKILINDFELGIVEACSGLRMLVTFITFSTAICLIVDKPISDKLLILVSAVPIALIVNVIRIVVTGVMYLHVSSETASMFFHDLAGWFMMPMALAFLAAELWILSRLFVDMPKRPAYR